MNPDLQIEYKILNCLLHYQKLPSGIINKIARDVDFVDDDNNKIKQHIFDLISIGVDDLKGAIIIDLRRLDKPYEEINKYNMIFNEPASVKDLSYYLNLQFLNQTKRKMQDLISEINSVHSVNINEYTRVLLGIKKEILKADEIFLDNDVINPSGLIENIFKERTLLSNKLKTGFTSLDEFTGGFLKGELVIIGARPAMGKLTLCLNLIRNVAYTNKIPTALLSVSQNNEILSRRFLQIITSLNLNEVKTEEQLKMVSKLPLIQEVIEKIKSSPVYFAGACNSMIENVVSQIHSLVRNNDVQLVIIDNLQALSSFKSRNGNREQEIAIVTRLLKKLAIDLNITIVCTSQLSRAVETRGGSKRPALSDLRESGAIEQDADKVIFLYRPEYYGLLEDESGMSTAGKMELLIAKNTNGITGEVVAGFEPASGRVGDYTPAADSYSYSSSRFSDLYNKIINKGDDAPF